MFSSAVPHKNQHYAELKRECIKDKTLFEDPEFPTTNASLYFRKPLPGIVQWKRPGVSGTGGKSPTARLFSEFLDTGGAKHSPALSYKMAVDLFIFIMAEGYYKEAFNKLIATNIQLVFSNLRMQIKTIC